MSCPSSYAFNKDYSDYYTINLLNIKIYEPEKLDEYKKSTWNPISTSSYMRIEKMHNLHKIVLEANRLQSCYTSPFVSTHGTTASDQAYWQKIREDYQKGCLTNAYNQIRKEFIKIVQNCKKILIEYDMLEEFKRYNPSMANFFDFKENDFTDEIIATYKITDPNSNEFIRGVKMCALSQEADDKRNAKYKLQRELRDKTEKEKKELIYKKEFDCIKLFDEIDKRKMKSSEIYVEYKKILELKQIYKPNGVWLSQNTQFVDYFTNEKKKEINVLISKYG